MSKKKPKKTEITEVRKFDIWIALDGNSLPFFIVKLGRKAAKVRNELANEFEEREDFARPILGVCGRLKPWEVKEMKKMLEASTSLEDVLAWGVIRAKMPWNRLHKQYLAEQRAERADKKAAEERARARYPVTSTAAPAKTIKHDIPYTRDGIKQAREEAEKLIAMYAAGIASHSAHLTALTKRLDKIREIEEIVESSSPPVEVNGVSVETSPTAPKIPAPGLEPCPPLPVAATPIAKGPAPANGAAKQANDMMPNPSVIQPKMGAVLENNKSN